MTAWLALGAVALTAVGIFWLLVWRDPVRAALIASGHIFAGACIKILAPSYELELRLVREMVTRLGVDSSLQVKSEAPSLSTLAVLVLSALVFKVLLDKHQQQMQWRRGRQRGIRERVTEFVNRLRGREQVSELGPKLQPAGEATRLMAEASPKGKAGGRRSPRRRKPLEKVPDSFVFTASNPAPMEDTPPAPPAPKAPGRSGKSQTPTP